MWCRVRDMDCDQVKVEEVGEDSVKSGRVRSFVQAVLRGQKEQKKAAEERVKIAELIEKVADALAEKAGTIDEEARAEIQGVVLEAGEALKRYMNPVQLQVVTDGLQAMAGVLKIDL
jgi:hypothetical protein